MGLIHGVAGRAWAVAQDGTTWRVLADTEIGFVGRVAREPTSKEQVEARQHAPMGAEKGDCWHEHSPLGRTSAVDVVAPEVLRLLLRGWRD